MQQLKLFPPVEPEFKDITIEWLFDFLNSQYPEMKFFIKKSHFRNGKPCIVQNLHKKIECNFYIGEFDDWVTCVKNRNYIGVHYGKEFGDHEHFSSPIDTMEEFKKYLPRVIEEAKKNIVLYKEYIKNRKAEEEEC